MNRLIEEHLGKSLSASEVADYLSIDTNTVRKHYQKLGGIRIGKVYRFFEKGLINAILGQFQEKMGSSDKISKQQIQEIISNQGGGKALGIHNKGAVLPISRGTDRHNLTV